MAPSVDAATRKRVLKVIFVSLLLDLVGEPNARDNGDLVRRRRSY